MKMASIVMAAFAFALISSSAYANGAEPAAAPAKTECQEQPCFETVVKKKVIGYKEKLVKVPIYKITKVKKKVDCKDNCKPKVVETENADIPAFEPIEVEQEQKIIVKRKIVIEHAPAPVVKLAPAKPIVYEQRQVVRAPQAPEPIIERAPPCPRPVVRAPCVRCPQKAAFVGGCPVPGSAYRGHRQQVSWAPTVDCAAIGGIRTTNPNTGRPTCFVP